MFTSIKCLFKRQTLLLNQRFQFGLIKFNLPDLGQKIKQGTIKKLYVKQGDKVQQFQRLADVASDKQFTQITASDAGLIKKIYFNQEQICQVGDLFLQIETESTTQQQSTSGKSSITQQVKRQINSLSKDTQTLNNQLIGKSQALATPFVRGLLKQYNLKIQEIVGSGPQGRILQSDVLSVIQGKKTKRVPSIAFGIQKIASQKQAIQAAQSKKSQKKVISNLKTQQSFEVKKMSLFEKGMQKSMTIANTIPHLYYHQEMDLTECQKLRSTLKSAQKKVTVMGLLIKTFSMALKSYPRINSTYHPQKSQFQFLTHASHNITIAIDSPNGLMVPNIKNVESLTLIQIQKQIQRLRDLSVGGKLTSNQLNGGTVCISNIGTIGGVMANPLILAPQTCIVAIGKLQTLPKWVHNEFKPRKVINVSFGCDHRILDGATVARFTNQWKKLLENPYIAMADMI